MIANLSDRQESFVRDMLAEIFADAPAGSADVILDRNVAAGLFATKESTRNAIDKLIAKRDMCRAERRAAGRKADAPAATAIVPAGYYAVEYDGVLRFYRVVVKVKGAHAGRTFVNRFKSDDELFVSRKESGAVLALIAADVDAAGMAFVIHSEHCRMCGRRLTDLATAKVNGGYGPECVKKI
jgi:hypothetical protein